jgi:hypothetical protein
MAHFSQTKLVETTIKLDLERWQSLLKLFACALCGWDLSAWDL